MSEMIFKIILIGDSSSGKTNIINRYISDKFVENSQPTIGVEMFSRDYLIDGDSIHAQIWDTAGQEKYNTLTSSYYKGAKGALVVYDVTQKATFDQVERYVNELKDNSDKNVFCALVGNKCDLEGNRMILKEEGEKLAQKLKIAFFEVSAKTGVGIENLFKYLIDGVYKKNSREFKSVATIEMDEIPNIKLNEPLITNYGGKKKCC